MSGLQTIDLSIVRGGTQLLAPLALTVHSGQMLGIIGPNGAGKSTLLRSLAGLERPSSGQVLLDGRNLTQLPRIARARLLGYHAQDPRLHWPLSVANVIALGRLAHGSTLARLNDDDRAAVAEAVRLTGLGTLLDRRADSLSGGELARVHLARLFAGRQPILLVDEPTSNLDPRYQAEILTLLARHSATGGTVVVVLHDLNLAARHCHRLLLLAAGQAQADGTPEAVLTTHHLETSFGVNADYLTDTGIDRALAAGRRNHSTQ